MEHFVVNSCTNAGCLYHRPGNKCAKNNAKISRDIPQLNNLHDAQSCQVRAQINQYRLEKLLEGE